MMDADTAACIALVERGDPARFAALLAAPPESRPALATLYAFTLEIARAPWASAEPMIAEMRLQWWRDAIADLGQGTIRAHEVMQPLARLVTAQNLPLNLLDRAIESRRWDIYRDAFADQNAFDAYIDDTTGGLTWLCAKALGAPDTAEPIARDFGWAAGLATYLQAVPELEARGRVPLLDGRAEGIKILAQRGLDRLARARAARTTMPKQARPAFLAGWQAEKLLGMAVKEPARVAEGQLHLAEFAKRGGLLWQALTGRW